MIAPYIKHNAVVEHMRQMGYKIVAFKTGYDFSTMDDADILYSAPHSGISDFELTLLRSTVLVLMDDAGMLNGIYPTAAPEPKGYGFAPVQDIEKSSFRPGTEICLCPSISSPLAVYFWPQTEKSLVATDFVETARGVTDKEYFDGYRGQAIFTSNQILDVVSENHQKV